jgi:signal transduction histidine kinase
MSKTLQQKNTTHLFVRLFIVMLAGSVFFYFIMRMHAHHMQQKQLELSQLNVWRAFKQLRKNMPEQISGEYEINDESVIPQELLHVPRDTSIYYPGLKERLFFEILTNEYTLDGKEYQITTFVSSKEINHLIIKVFITEAFILVLLFVAVIYINRKTSAQLWMPFRTTLKKLNEYDITQSKIIDLTVKTGIREFDELNDVALNLIAKINQAYHNQKQFVENASHEIQTPLSIIRSKLELLIDQPGITEEIAILLKDITEANERLSQMNKNLLLIAKIENNQFPSQSSINISVLINQAVSTYQQHYEERFPSIITSFQQNITVTANHSLLEIMINNLIRNAVIHNIPSGYIKIEIENDSLKIINTGPEIKIDPEQLFERFRKGNDEIKSTGLGLAIVKQICALYDFKINYSYDNGIHVITVRFENATS